MNNIPKRADDILNLHINGFHQYIFDDTLHLSFVSRNFCEMTGYEEDELLDESRDSYALLVDPKDLKIYSSLLDKVRLQKEASAKYHLIKKDESLICVLDTMTCIEDEDKLIVSSYLTDISEFETDNEISLPANENISYLEALSEVYDKIFEFSTSENTVKCLYCDDLSMFKQFKNIPMSLDEALDKWIMNSVDKSDRETVRSFFADFRSNRFCEPVAKPPQINYTALASDNVYRQYGGIFIKVNDSTGYFCCRRIHESSEVEELKNQTIRLKEKMKDLVMQFSDGLAAFELTPEETVKPLYASENVGEFFGYSKEEWLLLTKTYTPWKDFVSRSEASYEDFINFLKKGEEEFTYFDYKTETEKRIRAVCTQKDLYAKSPRYVVLYSVDEKVEKSKKEIPENRNVSIRTFGYFDVFVNNKPIAFKNKKSKELLAVLTDRKGGFVSSEEAISYLWEDEPANTLTFSRYRKVALRLKNTLEEYGVSDIVETVDGKRRIVIEKVNCDLFDYLSGKEEYSQLFKGSYLNNYSWGETTLGELINS